MNTKKMTQEQISAFADGELADSHVDMALAALRQPEGKATWDAYHRIGDVLRSSEMALDLSPGFAARMAARLEAEPAIVAPAVASAASTGSSSEKQVERADSRRGIPHGMRRFAVPGLAAAAATAFAFVMAPHMVSNSKDDAGSAAPHLASASAPARVSPGAIMTAAASAASTLPASASGNPPDGVVLRDPNIDEYLMAHQRFSPSVYSTAQFARSSTFANESDK